MFVCQHPQPGSCARVWSDGTAADQTLKSRSPTEPITMTSFHPCSPNELQGIHVPEDVCLANQQTGGISIQCSGPNPEGLFQPWACVN